MGKIKKYKNRVEAFLSGDSGQRFFNFAYSIGAAIVIWGALFKILHLPGGNLLLAIGMGTEVLMFVLTAFDRPPKQYNWEEVFPVLETRDPADRPQLAVPVDDEAEEQPAGRGNISINISGQRSQAPSRGQSRQVASGDQGQVVIDDGSYDEVPVAVGDLASAAASLPDLSPMTEISESYVGEMDRVIQELTHLRETTMALNTLYELQLKSISAQLTAIEHSGRDISSMRDMMEQSARMSEKYCAETEKMAENMATINSIYAGMIAAMSSSQQQRPQ